MVLVFKEQTASFDVDPQNTFTPNCPNELPVPDGHLIAGELNNNATLASIRVGSKDAHSPDAIWIASDQKPQFSSVENGGNNVDIHWNAHAIIGTEGFNLIDSLPKVEDYDFFVWKGIEKNLHPYGACYHDLNNKMSTGVIEYLKVNNITTVIVGGLAFEYCVKNTVLQLIDAGFNVIINLSSTKALTDENFKNTIQEFEQIESVTMVNSISEIKMVNSLKTNNSAKVAQ